MRQDKFSLAAAGFCYTNKGDIYECFVCGVKLSQWDLCDNTFVEHKKWSSDCLFLKIIGYGEQQTEDDQDVYGISSFFDNKRDLNFPW